MKKNKFLFPYFLIGFLFLTTTLNCFGQTVSEKDTLAKYTYDELSEKFYTAKPDSLKAVNYAKYYIEKAKRENDTLQQGEGYYYLSDITKDSIYFVGYWKDIIENIASKNKRLFCGTTMCAIGMRIMPPFFYIIIFSSICIKNQLIRSYLYIVVKVCKLTG